MTIPDFDLENEDIPVIEPSGIFKLWVRTMQVGGVILIVLGLLLLFNCPLARAEEPIDHSGLYCGTVAEEGSDEWSECIVNQYAALMELLKVVKYGHSIGLGNTIDTIFWQCKEENTLDNNGIDFNKVVGCINVATQKLLDDLADEVMKRTPKHGI